MTAQNRTTLKGYFNTGDTPTEAEFTNLIDSFHNTTDDGSVPEVSSGAGAPGSTPAAVGDIYIDTTNDAVYVATDTTGSGDWDEVATLTGGTDLSTYTGLVGVNSGSAVDVNTSALLAARISDETGSGSLVFGTSPTIATPTINGYLNNVVGTVSGVLTTGDHSGNILLTSGNVTVPTTAGFNCVLVAGGAHTVTFNSTTSAAMAAGDLMTIVVEDSTTIHAVLTAAADKVSFT